MSPFICVEAAEEHIYLGQVVAEDSDPEKEAYRRIKMCLSYFGRHPQVIDYANAIDIRGSKNK